MAVDRTVGNDALVAVHRVDQLVARVDGPDPLAQVRLERLEAAVALYRALGGGWQVT